MLYLRGNLGFPRNAPAGWDERPTPFLFAEQCGQLLTRGKKATPLGQIVKRSCIAKRFPPSPGFYLDLTYRYRGKATALPLSVPFRTVWAG